MQGIAWLLRRRLDCSCQLALSGSSKARPVGLTTAAAARPPCRPVAHSRHPASAAGAAGQLPAPEPYPTLRQPQQAMLDSQAAGRSFASCTLRRRALTAAAAAGATASQGSTGCCSPPETQQPGRGRSAGYATSAACSTAEGERLSGGDADGPGNDLHLLIERLENPPPDTCAPAPSPASPEPCEVLQKHCCSDWCTFLCGKDTLVSPYTPWYIFNRLYLQTRPVALSQKP